MKIGAWSFNDIIAMSFTKARVMFTATWLFVLLTISVLANLLVNLLLNAGVSGLGITLIDTLHISSAVLIILYISLGVTASLKIKTKLKSFAALAKPLFIKQLLVVLVGLVAIALGVILAFIFGQLGRIPTAGPILMSILAIPFVIGFAYIIIFAGLTLKLSAAAVVENSKASLQALITELLFITKHNFAKMLFNGFLLLWPLLTIALATVIIFGLAYVGYVLFGWVVTGNYAVLMFCMQGELNAVYVLQTLSGLALISFAGSYFVNVVLTGLYSIYLDAHK